MNGNISRKKRRTKKYRLVSSKEWIRNYDGKNIVKGYSKWYGVDLLCAIKELRMNGVIVDEVYEEQVKESIKAKTIARQISKENRKKRLNLNEDEFLDGRFAFIAGYTSGGAAYGVTHEEMRNYEEENSDKDFNEF